MIWIETEQELIKFLNAVNEANVTVKFTWSWSIEGVNYLDVQLTNNQGKIETDLYAKPLSSQRVQTGYSIFPCATLEVYLLFRGYLDKGSDEL